MLVLSARELCCVSLFRTYCTRCKFTYDQKPHTAKVYYGRRTTRLIRLYCSSVVFLIYGQNRLTQLISKTEACVYQSIRFATKKAGGSTKNGRDSPGKRLGIKKFGGEYVISGNIIVRQRGRNYINGENTKLGRDFTLYAVQPGYVKFTLNHKNRQVISVVPDNPNPPPYVKKEKYTPVEGRTPVPAFIAQEL